MDSGTVKTLTDAVGRLIPLLVEHAAREHDKRTPEDDALIRQLRVAAGAINHALMEIPRPPSPMPPQPNVRAP